MAFPCNLVHELLGRLRVFFAFVKEHLSVPFIKLFVRPVFVVEDSILLILFLLRMKLDLEGGLALFIVDKAGRGEDVVKRADKTFVQTLPANKAKPGGLDVVNKSCMGLEHFLLQENT